ncbi:MAG: hypothetical protein ABJ308_07165 [Halieaceae bacterium]
MKTIDLDQDRITVEFTEFEIAALSALVERGQLGIEVDASDTSGIRYVITETATEFRSLMGHFELMV